MWQYVAHSKLCSRENMDHIDRAGGRFVTVLPRNRLEDAEFRQWIQTNTPDWTCVWDRPNSRHSDGPRDCWYVFRAPLLSAEAWPVVWVWSPLLTLRQEARRRRNIAAAVEEFQQLRVRLAGSKTRLRGAAEIDLQIKVILEKHHVARYLKVRRTVREEHEYKQTRRGRPGPETAYRKITRQRFDIEWTTDEQASNSHFERSASETTVEAVETMSALSGIGWFDVEGLEHESEQMIPVIERKVLGQSTQVLKECTPRWK